MKELLQVLRESLPQIIAGLAVLAIVALLASLNTWLGPWTIALLVATLALAGVAWYLASGRSRAHSPALKPIESPLLLTSSGAASATSLGAIAIFKPSLDRNGITAKLHKQASLKLDTKMKTAFDQLNQRRRSLGRLEYFASTRYRLIRLPQFYELAGEMIFVLDIAEINFVYFALLQEDDVDVSMKEYVRDKMRAVAERLPKQLQGNDDELSAMNAGLLGVQMVLITSDGYTHLRRRGASVLEHPNKWDVSFSGYSGINVFSDNDFDIGNTVEYELEYEIRRLNADPRGMKFTGLHFSRTSGTAVMLGYWSIEATARELASYLNEKYQRLSLVFDSTIKAKEKYVWDTKNMIVQFDGPAIAESLYHADPSISDNPDILMPAARASLILALTAHNKSIVGLEV